MAHEAQLRLLAVAPLLSFARSIVIGTGLNALRRPRHLREHSPAKFALGHNVENNNACTLGNSSFKVAP